MKLRKTTAMAALALALTATAACGGKDGEAGDQEKKTDEKALPTYEVAKDVDIDSAVFEKAKKRGKLIIGAKADQPYLGFQNQSSKKYEGFDIEIAKMVAADLGFDPEKQVQFKTIDSSIRETAISKGQVDLMVGTYTINDERKKQVDFVGPYYMAGQDLLVRKDEKDIKGPDSIKGKKVCSITGSTPLQNIKENKGKYGAEPVEFGKYTDCVKQLIDGQVDAMTTDDAILKGYAAQRPTKLKVVGELFSEEPYGIGLKKGQDKLQKAVTDAVKKHQENGDYEKAYDATLGLSGSKFVEPPALDN
ncbi:glutamate ABC transporter substrate-binding protein [Streptomyces sp. AJS327]|uniref:glutamate ABC transporter substrate-binding protein n=1 Tax=Streptomyces sp. AJS327 TaxID=2545265 RepID=UPI0015DDC5B1|nr:glutamate ABC transporter substrate-binding protein [Streptomyces sp. AJS327]MBA0051926.1 glutamate ABC transporter substrate-binding protein [Streptomyces sp. AJS327]